MCVGAMRMGEDTLLVWSDHVSEVVRIYLNFFVSGTEVVVGGRCANLNSLDLPKLPVKAAVVRCD